MSPVNNTTRKEDERAKRREIIGFKLAGVGRSVSFSTALFLAVAVLRLAIKAAGCNTQNEESCDKTIYGFRPTSLLAIMNTLGNFLAACMMPLFGSIIDHTPHRREMAKCAMYLFILINGVQAMVSMDTWFAVSVLQMFTSTCLIAMQTSQFAYMPEMTDDQEKELPRIMAVARAYELLGVLVFAFLVTLIARQTGAGGDNIAEVVQRARIGQMVGTSLGGCLMVLAWHVYLSARPALHPLRPGESVCSAGISQVRSTFVQLNKDYPSTARFFIAFSFWEAATAGLLSCSVTYLNELGLSAQEIVFFILTSTVFGAVGAAGSQRCVPVLGVKKSMIGVLATFVFLTIVWMCISSPRAAFMFAFPFGICYGVVHPVQRTGFSLLVPGGQEAEYAGLFTCSGMVLSWAVPLLFVVLNESTGSVVYGLLAPILFHTIGMLILITIDFDEAIEPVQATLNRREGAAFHQSCNATATSHNGTTVAHGPAPTVEMTPADEDVENAKDAAGQLGGDLVPQERKPEAEADLTGVAPP